MLDGAEREVAAEHELGCVGSDSGTMEGDGTTQQHDSGQRRQRPKSASTAIATAATVAAANMETHSSDGSVGSGGNEGRRRSQQQR